MKNIYVILHEMDFDDAFSSTLVDSTSFKTIEDARKSLLSHGYKEHEDLTFTHYEDGVSDYATIVETVLK